MDVDVIADLDGEVSTYYSFSVVPEEEAEVGGSDPVGVPPLDRTPSRRLACA
jgi:hypothetical protein